jgi:RNA polymerase sigma-70 factor, ECF subfamily
VSNEIGELYKQVGHLVLRRCVQILRDPEEAMDVVQWTFIRAIETGFVVRTRGEALSWLYRTAAHRCLWLMRNKSNRARITERHLPEMPAPPPVALEADLLSRDLLDQALSGLTEEHAELVLMTYVWGYSNDRAAQLAGTSVRTVGRARAAFEGRMKELATAEATS